MGTSFGKAFHVLFQVKEKDFKELYQLVGKYDSEDTTIQGTLRQSEISLYL